MSEIQNLEIQISETVDELLVELGVEALTPYAISQVANAVLQIVLPADVEFATVRSQYMYNYSKNGMIVRGSKRTGPGVTYTSDEVASFLKKYLVRRVTTGAATKIKISEKLAEMVASRVVEVSADEDSNEQDS